MSDFVTPAAGECNGVGGHNQRLTPSAAGTEQTTQAPQGRDRETTNRPPETRRRPSAHLRDRGGTEHRKQETGACGQDGVGGVCVGSSRVCMPACAHPRRFLLVSCWKLAHLVISDYKSVCGTTVPQFFGRDKHTNMSRFECMLTETGTLRVLVYVGSQSVFKQSKNKQVQVVCR